ncbi:hypothetical protein WR25_05328 [Diploscapter pachys]|uniref:Cell cycle control protein 50A n=1 Tax=Diploscapter pachys TaxID=2018661 RepID=A0A2A2M158_9BILA|nr:hypothetical protein WR25_05328 [Diploscapter pachys]
MIFTSAPGYFECLQFPGVMPQNAGRHPENSQKEGQEEQACRYLIGAWRQQNLPAYRPHVTVGSAIPVTLAVGLALTGLGVAMFIGTKNSLETEIDYTSCEVENSTQFNGSKMSPFKCSFTINLTQAYTNTTQPPDWSRRLCDLGYGDNVGLGLENLDFMVWMKPAALPKFRKLYRILDTQSNSSCESVSTTAGYSTTTSLNDDDGDKISMYENADASDYDLGAPVLSCQNLTNTTFDIISDLFNTGLPAGQYTLLINYNYPVTGFNGSKSFVIARETWVGPQNFFLPILYLVVGTFLILVSGFFLVIWLWQRYKKD